MRDRIIRAAGLLLSGPVLIGIGGFIVLGGWESSLSEAGSSFASLSGLAALPFVCIAAAAISRRGESRRVMSGFWGALVGEMLLLVSVALSSHALAPGFSTAAVSLLALPLVGLVGLLLGVLVGIALDAIRPREETEV